ncbi:MAG: transglycosylase SLT domain-containing protein [Bacteroidales bacterium]|nr:transglycosylase SLT domain-containing protein [Bacteroidales bacterium]
MKAGTREILIAIGISIAFAVAYYFWYSRKLHPLLRRKTTGTEKDEYIKKLESVSRNLRINPNALWLVINSESRHNPGAINPYNGATGLIQFVNSTAQTLGTSFSALRQMSRIDQLDYVQSYYKMFKRASNYSDLYLTTFYPYALGKPDSYIFGSEVSPARVAIITAQNPFDENGDGEITMKEFKTFARKQIVAGVVPKWFEYLLM